MKVGTHMICFLAATLTCAACSAPLLSDGTDRVTSIAIEPANPNPGEEVAIIITAQYKGIYPQMLGGDRPPVRFAVDGGELFFGPYHNHDLQVPNLPAGPAMDVTTAYWDFIYWRLPDEPGTYHVAAKIGDRGQNLSVTTAAD